MSDGYGLTTSGLYVPTFGRDVKASRIQEAGVRQGLTAAQVPNRFKDYNSYLTLGPKLPFVAAATRVITNAFASCKWDLADPDDDEVTDDSNDPLYQLMAKPNPFQSQFEFKLLAMAFLLYTGNCFITLEERDSAGQPAELYLANPARMTIVPDPKNFIAGYAYDVGYNAMSGGRSQLIPYAPEEVIHLKVPSPSDEYWGMGPVEQMEVLLEIVSAMATHELGYWKSGGRIIGTLETDNELTEDQFDGLRRGWAMANQDEKQRARVAILQHGVKYTPIAEGLRSLDLVNIDASKRDSVLAVFGVPKQKVGIFEDAQYKAEDADEYFWTETMQPWLNLWEDGIQPLVDLFDDTKVWKFERRTYEDDTAKLQNAQMMQALHFTDNEIRSYLAAPEIGKDGDVIWVNSTMTPLHLDDLGTMADETIEPPAPPALPALSPTPATAGADTAAGGSPPKPPKQPGDNIVQLSDHLPAMTGIKVLEAIVDKKWSEERIKELSRVVRRERARGRKAASGFDRVGEYHTKRASNALARPKPNVRGSARHPVIAETIRRHRDRVAGGAIREAVPRIRDVARAQQAAIVKVLPKVLKAEKPAAALREAFNAAPNLGAALGPLYREVVTAGHDQTARMLPPRKRLFAWSVKAMGNVPTSPADTIAAQFPKLGERINTSWQNIDNTTLDRITGQVEEGIRRGYSSLQIANGVTDEQFPGIHGVFNEITDWRADMIARTEAMHAYTWGQWASMGAAGVRQAEASDGTEFDEECSTRNGTVYDLDEEGTPIDNGMGIEDHPNGTLDWIPMAESIQTDDGSTDFSELDDLGDISSAE